MESLRDWALGLPAEGRYTFTTGEAQARQTRASAAGVAAALARARADGIIASPVRGFHVVLPLEDRKIGTPAWRLFLDPLMQHLRMPYYVGLLTAASVHGAGAQAPQVVQVASPRARRPVTVGGLRIEFVVSRSAGRAPVELLTTRSGRVRVATPEVVVLDLVRFPARAGGWANVLTVLRDLAPRLRQAGMRKALAVDPSAPDLQRLGHLLERVGADATATVLARALAGRHVTWVRLAPDMPLVMGEPERDPRWHIIVNSTIEAD